MVLRENEHDKKVRERDIVDFFILFVMFPHLITTGEFWFQQILNSKYHFAFEFFLFSLNGLQSSCSQVRSWTIYVCCS